MRDGSGVKRRHASQVLKRRKVCGVTFYTARVAMLQIAWYAVAGTANALLDKSVQYTARVAAQVI